MPKTSPIRRTFALTPVARATSIATLAVAAMGAISPAQAGPGFVDAIAQDGSTIRLQTYFAYSPSGARDTAITEDDALAAAEGRLPNFTGKPLRKFVDPLPLPGAANAQLMADGVTTKYIPVATATKWISPNTGLATNDDYYEIGVVEFNDRFHSDLKKRTVLRGYIQIDHLASNGRGQIAGSKALFLYYPNSSGQVAFASTADAPADAEPIMIAATDAKGFRTGALVQARSVDEPRFLGPVVAATKDVPTRFKFMNLLPVGRSEWTTDPVTGKFVVSNRHGDIFLPTDKAIFGAGIGPDGFTEYTQNRASVHLHGGDTPWVSDGTAHQWIAPRDESDPANVRSLAARFADPAQGLDPVLLPDYLRGPSSANVPDMPDPGAGATTLYYPNGQSARMMWYHDHTFGATRLNVYAGMASGYLLTDEHEQAMIADGTLPPAERTIPLVLQDRTFVPDDISLQDSRWSTTGWGAPGDSWFPHVYETVQDPAQINSWNAVGRWHYGPWFWPVFPSLYPLPEGTWSPEGHENTVGTTPEAWMDTPIINGVAYPVLEVDPTTYRFKILNAANDRIMTFNFFESKVAATLPDGTLVSNTEVVDANGNLIPSEVDMVPATLTANTCPAGQLRPTQIGGVFCQPAHWPTDNRDGGMPSPAAVGPTLYQVGSEGGFLPKVVALEPQPITYLQDKGRANVLNVDTKSLFLAPAERADVVVDFSAYAGKTLVVYNDSGAPIPASDPRNETFSGAADQSGAGGAETTKAGYGPNSRTMMLVRVKASGTSTPLDVPKLKAGITAAYAASADRPVVAQPEYADIFNEPSWKNIPASVADSSAPAAYANIYTATLKQPTFNFVPGRPDTGINGVDVGLNGSGYVKAPAVTIAAPAAPGGVAATAKATMSIEKFIVTAGGSGYTTAPVFRVVGGGGNGATGTVTLGINAATVTAGGTGYTSAPTVNFSAPPAGGTKPVATAVVSAGKVVGINVTTPGKGYSAAPLVSITGGGGTGAKATSSGFVDAIKVDIPFPDKPTIFGGGGYIDLDANSTNPDITPITYTFTGGNGTGATATATGRVFNVSLTHPGSGYAANEVPTVTLGTPPSGVGSVQATATANAVSSNYLVKNKGIQELFDPTYGRLNATFSTELPFTSGLVQTTIPLAFVDAPTEMFADGETQIWKITHNGVDTHPVHFHLLNVQLINRVSWDGFIMPPDANELGWKETVRMNPLEDIIVAVKAKRPPLPGFGVPDSIRPMDPSQPLDSPYGFSQIDPSTGMPAVVTNQLYNFGWEYTWHCHILGHEENDFMRPWQFDAKDLLVKAPALGGVSVNGDGSRTVSWTDATPYGAVASLTDSSAEVGFRVQRSINGGSFADVATGLTNVRGLNKPGSGLPGVPALVNTLANATSYIDSLPIVVPVPDALAAPTPSTIATNAVTLGWSLAANAPATSFNVMRQVAGSGAFDQIGTLARVAGTTSYSFDDTTAQPGASYVYRVDAVVGASGATASVTYQVVAVNVKGEAASGASAAMDLPATGGGTTAGVESAAVNTPPMAPTFTGTGLLLNSTTSATVSWAAAQGAASYQVRYCQAIAATGETCTMGAWNAVTGATSYTATGLTAGSYVQFEVQALSAANAASASAFAPSATTRSFVGLPGTAAATVASRTASSIVLNLSASNATGYQIKVAASDAALATAAWQNVTGSSYTITGTTSTQYFYQVQALNNGLIGTASAAANAWTLATAVAAAPTVSNLANTSLTLNWVGTGASSYTVQRATNATFTQGLSTTGNLTGTSLNVSGLTANRTYYFRVVAVNGGGNTSAASPTLNQVTLGTAPTTVSARNGQAGGTVSGGLNFRGGVATRYEIRWANNNAMTGATLISTGVTSGTLYTLPVAASNVANVWMQVRAVNSAGVAGDWAPVAPVGVIAR